MKRLMMCLGVLLAGAGYASEEHGIGKIQSKDLDLSYIDHVLSGRIYDRPILAKPLEGQFGISLWHRAEGENFATEFKKVGDTFLGEIASIDLEGAKVSAEYRVTEVHAEEGRIVGRVGEVDFELLVTSEEMSGHHYVEPVFSYTFNGEKKLSFKLENGQACMGCVMKLSYAIVSMIYAYGAL